MSSQPFVESKPAVVLPCKQGPPVCHPEREAERYLSGPAASRRARTARRSLVPGARVRVTVVGGGGATATATASRIQGSRGT
jgi:hypothetical protein